MKDGIGEMAVASLGKGFDLTSDCRLKYCKGNRRLVLLNEAEKRDLPLPGFPALRDVSVDIICDKGDRVRYQSDILDFNQVIINPSYNPLQELEKKKKEKKSGGWAIEFEAGDWCRCLSSSTRNHRFLGKFRLDCSMPCLDFGVVRGLQTRPTPSPWLSMVTSSSSSTFTSAVRSSSSPRMFGKLFPLLGIHVLSPGKFSDFLSIFFLPIPEKESRSSFRFVYSVLLALSPVGSCKLGHLTITDRSLLRVSPMAPSTRPKKGKKIKNPKYYNMFGQRENNTMECCWMDQKVNGRTLIGSRP